MIDFRPTEFFGSGEWDFYCHRVSVLPKGSLGRSLIVLRRWLSHRRCSAVPLRCFWHLTRWTATGLAVSPMRTNLLHPHFRDKRRGPFLLGIGEDCLEVE